jgi:hypothetical protein
MGFPTRASWVADLAGCAGLPTVQVGDRQEEWPVLAIALPVGT